VIPAATTSEILAKNGTAATTVVLLARFTIPPFPCWLSTNHVAKRSLELDAQQLKLTR
jgi:hypothetical protein